MSGLPWPWGEPAFYLCLVLCLLVGMAAGRIKNRRR